MPDTVLTGPTALLPSAHALAQLLGHAGERSITLFQHGSLLVKLYAPRHKDAQTPHTRDELYLVARGHGSFFDGTTHSPFGPGDMVFIAAGTPHRFEDFTDDFAVWVVYYGPEGGEPRSSSKSAHV